MLLQKLVNTATGASALFGNGIGNANTAMGANTLLLNASGCYNAALGSQAMYSNTTGNYDTASIEHGALSRRRVSPSMVQSIKCLCAVSGVRVTQSTVKAKEGLKSSCGVPRATSVMIQRLVTQCCIPLPPSQIEKRVGPPRQCCRLDSHPPAMERPPARRAKARSR